MRDIPVSFIIPYNDFILGTLLLIYAIVLYLAISNNWEWLENRPNPLPWLAKPYVALLLAFGFAAIAFAFKYWIWDIRGEIGGIITLLNIELELETPRAENIRNLAYAIGALLAAVALSATIPFQLIKVWVNERLAKTTEQGHMTDRITKAVEQLGAEKTVWEGSEQKTVPNLEVRLGAIYALERIAQDSLRDHIPVMEILCAYVRNNAPASEAKQSPHEVFRELAESCEDSSGLNAEDIYRSNTFAKANPFGWNPTELTSENLIKWARWLPSPRSDIQAAISGIGRRSAKRIIAEGATKFRLDLSRCNLQKAFLHGNFDNCDFTESRFDGAEAKGSLNGVRATSSSWQCARMWKIHCMQSVFIDANLSSAFLGGSVLDKCDFRYSKMNAANFNGASVQQCDWYAAIIKSVYFYQDANASWGRFHRCSTQNLNGINQGLSKNLFAVDEEAKKEIEPERLFSEVDALDNERDAHSAWLKAKAAANL